MLKYAYPDHGFLGEEIGAETVTLEVASKEIIEIPNSAVIICAGGVLPTPFLKDIGVMIETHYGKAIAA